MSWLLLIRLLVLAMILVASPLPALASSAASEVLVVLLVAATSRSVVEFVSSVAAHVVHGVLLRV